MSTMRDTFAFMDLVILALTLCSPARRLHILFRVPGANHGWNGRGGQAGEDARTKDWCQLSCISWPLLDCVAVLLDKEGTSVGLCWFIFQQRLMILMLRHCWTSSLLLMKCKFCWLKLDLVWIFVCQWKRGNHLPANDCMCYRVRILYEKDILKVI